MTEGKLAQEQAARCFRRIAIHAPTVLDDRVYCQLPDATYDRLIEVFLREVCESARGSDSGWCIAEDAWCHFIFAAIALGGLAGPDSLPELLQMQFEHIAGADQGYIYVPRAGGLIPVFVDDLVVACSLSLCVHLMRGLGGGRNRVGPFPSDGYLLPGREHPCIQPTPGELRVWRKQFKHWLEGLCAAAGIRVTIGQLALLTRGRLAQIYAPPVAGALLGFHLYNPAPVKQRNAFGQYREPLDWNRVRWANMTSSTRPPRPRAILTQMHGGSNDNDDHDESKNELSATMADLRRIAVTYSRREKRPARAVRRRVLSALRHLAGDLRARMGKQASESWSDFLTRLDAAAMETEQIDAVNAIILAEWLEGIIRRSPPNTVEARLNDLMKIVSLAPDRLLCQVDEPFILDLLPRLSLSPGSQARWANSVRGLHRFLREGLGIPVPAIAWWRLHNRRTIREQHLLTQPDFERLLIELSRMGRDGHLALVGALLG